MHTVAVREMDKLCAQQGQMCWTLSLRLPFINLNSIFATVTTHDMNWNKSALHFVGNLAML